MKNPIKVKISIYIVNLYQTAVSKNECYIMKVKNQMLMIYNIDEMI